MATATVPSSLWPSLIQAGKTLYQGLFCSSGLLLVYSLWVAKGHPEITLAIPAILWILVAAGVGLGIWQFLGVSRTGQATETAAADLARQRRLVGLLLVAAGGLLGVLAGYLGVTLGLKGLGESLGLALFALFTLTSGSCYLQPIRETPSSAVALDSLLPLIGFLRSALLLVGIGCLAVFFWLGFGRKIGSEYFPELTSLLFEGLLCLACGMWLSLSSPEERSVFSLRIFLLILGGMTGLFVTLLGVFKAIVWRQEVILGGIGVWQGENGWKVWLCAYIALMGLVLMFGSVLLTRGDIRANPMLRQVLYGYNAIVTGLLLLAFLAVFNIVCYTMFPMTFEWSRLGGLVSLSQKSKNLIGNLKAPVTVYVLLPSGHPAYQDTEAILNNALTLSDKLHVKKISPDQDFLAYESLAMHFKEILPSGRGRNDPSTGRGLLVVYGYSPADLDKEDPTKKVPHAFIPERKIFEETGGRGEKGSRFFRGEVELMRELDFLQQGQKQQKVYFLQGNGELDINNNDPRKRIHPGEDMSQRGASELVDRLKKDNYQVQGLNFGHPTGAKKDSKDNVVFPAETGADKRKEVPEDASVLAVLGSSQELPKDTLEALERYMTRGGKLLVSLDVVLDQTTTKIKTSGVEEFLKKYGVQATSDFAMRFMRPLNEDPRIAYAMAPDTDPSSLAKQFAGPLIPFHSIRIVRPEAKAVKYKAGVLLEVVNTNRFVVWEESNVRAIKDPVNYLAELFSKGQIQKKIAEEPLPVALTVAEDGSKPRMVVFGDTEFLGNFDITRSKYSDVYYSLFVGSLEWMAERPGAGGLKPKETQTYALPAGVEANRLIVLPGWLMTLGILGLGTGIWLIRRR